MGGFNTFINFISGYGPGRPLSGINLTSTNSETGEERAETAQKPLLNPVQRGRNPKERLNPGLNQKERKPHPEV